jgi:F-type H+-transporting ATPase subunit delta
MEAPEITLEERTKALGFVLPSLSDATRNLLMLVAKRRAIKVLPQVYERFQELNDAARGLVRVQVTSAIELADDDQKRITGQLAASLGKEVQITTQVNSELLGGLVIRVGDRIIDGSARQRLNALKGSLARGIV